MFKKLLLQLLLVGAFLSAFNCAAIAQQVTNFSFAASSGTYTPISGANSVTLTTPSHTDGGNAYDLPIGFTFNYLGVDFTTVSASCDGYLVLGHNDLANQQWENNLASGADGSKIVSRPIIAALWDDLDIISSSNLVYQTTGVAPNRIFVMQWGAVKWDFNAAGSVIKFQIKLYENSGVIQFIYAPGDFPGKNFSGGASIGITDVSATGTGTFLSVSDLSLSATVSSVSETKNISAQTPILPGLTFTFSPPISCPNLPELINTCSGLPLIIEAGTNGTLARFSPLTDLYTDAACTVTYTGAPVSKVYAKRTASFTYSKTTFGGPCNGVVTEVSVNIPEQNVILSAFPFSNLHPGLETTLAATVTPNPAANYTWYKNGIEYLNGSSNSIYITVDGLGEYSVKATNSTGCSSLSDVFKIGDSATTKLYVYPNPTRGKFQVRYAGAGTPAYLVLVDTKGTRVATVQYTNTNHYGRVDVNISNCNKGEYLIALYDTEGKHLAKAKVLYH
jgi:Secretion system C-terminal sorting domain